MCKIIVYQVNFNSISHDGFLRVSETYLLHSQRGPVLSVPAEIEEHYDASPIKADVVHNMEVVACIYIHGCS